jgi:hypothetical protein
MRIHRTAHTRFFTTLGNEVLRDNRLSFCARGLLAHLMSLPDGHRDDIRSRAERTPEGRERIASALRELERFGYLRRTVRHTTQGRIYTEVDVYDTPNRPSSAAGERVAPPRRDRPACDRRADRRTAARRRAPSGDVLRLDLFGLAASLSRSQPTNVFCGSLVVFCICGRCRIARAAIPSSLGTCFRARLTCCQLI